MKITITKGKNPLNLVNYLLNPDKQKPRAALDISTNMFSATAEEFAEEFRFSHTLNPRVEKTMAHYSVALAPGERVTPTQRNAITKRLLELTGHGDCQYLSVEHVDRSHPDSHQNSVQHYSVQHWHIGTSTVDLDGHCIEDDFMRVRLRQIEKQLEQEFDLVRMETRPVPDQRHLSMGEYHRKQRTGETLPREKLWNKIQQHTADRPSLLVLVARLKADGVGVRFWLSDQQIKGISYEMEGWTYSGYKLGKAYSFKGLQAHLGVTYHPSQDEALLGLQQMNIEQCQEWLNR